MEIPANITKAHLAEFVPHYGKANAAPFREHEARSLVYRTFAGALDPDTRLYCGVHCFDPNANPEAETTDFDALFGEGEQPCL